MSSKPDFIHSTLSAYAKLKAEIASEASEYDVRLRIIKNFIEGLLNYSGKDYQAEKNRTDIRLLDETHTLPLVIIETKKPIIDISEEKGKEQAFGYADAFTKYVILTNGMQLIVWDTSNKEKAIVNLNFDQFLTQKKLTDEQLTVAEKAQILFLFNLSKEEMWSEKKYEDTQSVKLKIKKSNNKVLPLK